MNKIQLAKHVDSILIPHTAFQKGLQRLNQGVSLSGNEPIGFSLIGESRSGKSRLIEHFVSQYPQTRYPQGMQTQVLVAKTPVKPTIKGLGAHLLSMLGDPLADAHESENRRTLRLLKLLKANRTRVVILDEFQHFAEGWGKKVLHQVADWLKIILDESGVMLIVAGLPYSNAVLLQNEQLRGRFTAQIRLPRFDWNNPASKAEFCALLQAFGEAMHPFSLPDLGSEEMAFRFYIATGGLTGYVVKILRQASWNVLDDDRTQIHLEDLAIACEFAVWNDTEIALNQNPFSRSLNITDGNMMATANEVGKPAAEPAPKRGRPRKQQDMLAGVL